MIIGDSQTVRRLLLFRHAKAITFQAGMDDLARTLIPRGRKDSACIGSYMATEALVPDRVLVSPSTRTLETWKFTAPAFPSVPEEMRMEGLYEATSDAIIAIIRQTPAAIQSLLVIGHNPGLHRVALALIASGNAKARQQLRKKLPTSGLVIIDFAFDDWNKLERKSGRLDRFLTPSSL